MKEINVDYYKKIRFEGAFLTNDEDKDSEQGIIYVPWVIKDHTEESLKEYNDFMEVYHEQHKFCPNCGCEGNYSFTLMGYMLNMDKKDEYKDLNICNCQKCKNTHTFHERVK
jgi:phenolic acid decarboxylase